MMRILAGLVAMAGAWTSAVESAQACSCENISPAQGFDRAQFVFTGKVVKAGTHTWVVDVDRVWKGRDRLTRSAGLMDVYSQTDCQFFFKEGERYLIFAVVAKSPRELFYIPQACNWTSALHSKQVPGPDGGPVWLEDLIVSEHGPGEPPPEERGSGLLP